MAKKAPFIRFDQFLDFFPEVDLPVVLSDEAVHVFSQENEPLPVQAVYQYIQPTESKEIDETTEFVPCLRIKDTHEFQAVVFWRAALMDYQFVLITYTKDGSQVIDRRSIAGTYFDGSLLIRSVATIDQDWLIYVVSGQADPDKRSKYEASGSKTFNLELLPDGKIVNEI
ncbi:MAG: hypothetical protein GYB31_16475 [Bacteroidetes bacterium]|nr:hypothetical protein [Bacteroidota bacterium]